MLLQRSVASGRYVGMELRAFHMALNDKKGSSVENSRWTEADRLGDQ